MTERRPESVWQWCLGEKKNTNTPTTQFNKLRTIRHSLGNRPRMGRQNLNLRIRQVVLVQVRDLLEQLQSADVVQQDGGKGPFLAAIGRVETVVDGTG